MKKGPFCILRHAVTMVGRTLRSYIFLSVTIILSFSLLLGYLVWTDSSLYNAHKEIFSKDRNIVAVFDQKLLDSSFSKMLQERAADYGNTHTIQFDHAVFGSVRSRNSRLQTETGQTLAPISVCAISVPAHAWCLYSVGGRELNVTWLDGKDHADFYLRSGEILVDERLYSVFRLAERDNEFSLSLSGYYDGNGNLIHQPFGGSFHVVGTIAADEPLEIRESKDDPNQVCFVGDTVLPIAFAAADLNRGAYPKLNWYAPTAVFYSSAPEQVDALVRSVGITANISAVYAQQDRALEVIQNEIGLKMIITVALLVILGINLYSSFSNALNDRKFEIGVKRAIGASRFSIVRQFLYESLLVMAANILASVWLVLTAALTYKVVYEHIPNEAGEFFTFTLTLSPYSAAMFLLCSVTLTLVFSLIFAYKATQVQVVDYLKSE